MGAPKKPRKKLALPCAHVALDMLAYMAGLAVGPHAGDHTAILWCVDCGAVLHKTYARGEALPERVRLPRSALPPGVR